jgi:hypothetical protein
MKMMIRVGIRMGDFCSWTELEPCYISKIRTMLYGDPEWNYF